MNAPGPCLWCGRDTKPENVAPPAPQWTLWVPIVPPSLNDYLQNKGRGSWAYRKVRDEWCLALLTAIAKLGPGRDPCYPSGKRRVVFTRVFCGRERERDYVNLVGGMKLIVDVMGPSRTYERADKKGRKRTQMVPGVKLLLDDTPALLEDVYRQERGELSGLRIEITEVT